MQYLGYTYAKNCLLLGNPAPEGSLLCISDFSFLKNWGFLWEKGSPSPAGEEYSTELEERLQEGKLPEPPGVGPVEALGTAGFWASSELCCLRPPPSSRGTL